MRVVIDSREKEERIKEFFKYFYTECCECKVQRLDYGDYLFNNKVVFEYKTVQDFLNSVNDFSVFHEVTNQSQHYEHNFVIIVGDIDKELKKRYYYYRRTGNNKYSKMHNFIKSQKGKLNGAVRRLRTYSNVIFAKTDKLAMEEMLRQAEKCLDGKVTYCNVVRPANIVDSPVVTFLTCIKGINLKTAEKIVSTLDIVSLQDLVNVTHADLLSVDSVGAKKADLIIEYLQGGD